MTPVAIDSPAGPCFAAYHPAPGPAVLLVPPFGYEALATARILRRLCQELAEDGTASLRLDLPGTGDSAGEASVPAWRSAIDAALAWLRARHPKVALMGIRLGALLVLDAAARTTPYALILLDPPASGAAQVRQLRARARIEPGGGEDRRAYGLPLTDALLEGLGALPALPAAPVDTLLVNGAPAPPAWQAALHPLEAVPFPGRDAFLMQDSFQLQRPEPEFARIRAFLAARHVTASPPDTPASGLSLPGLTEQPLMFGPGLFGLLCRPTVPACPTACLIPTTGNLPRSGPGRSSVTLARRLAMAGFASLRYDCANAGESDGDTTADPAVETYLPHQVEHVRHAMDALAAHGHATAIALGHCSGAYLAWHAAAEDARIIAVFAANLQILKRMDPAEAQATVRPPRSAHTPTPVDGTRQPSAAARAKQLVQRLVPASLWDMARASTPGERAVRRQLRALAARGCPITFVFGDQEDESYRFHRAFRRPARLPPAARHVVIHGADHMFAAAIHRARLIDLATSFVALNAMPNRNPNDRDPA